MERIAWSEGQVDMDISPAADIDDYRMDFVAPSGFVILRLDFGDAATLSSDGVAAIFIWGVCEQPWADGATR